MSSQKKAKDVVKYKSPLDRLESMSVVKTKFSGDSKKVLVSSSGQKKKPENTKGIRELEKKSTQLNVSKPLEAVQLAGGHKNVKGLEGDKPTSIKGVGDKVIFLKDPVQNQKKSRSEKRAEKALADAPPLRIYRFLGKPSRLFLRPIASAPPLGRNFIGATAMDFRKVVRDQLLPKAMPGDPAPKRSFLDVVPKFVNKEYMSFLGCTKIFLDEFLFDQDDAIRAAEYEKTKHR
jgi:hypothetical protein